MWREVQLGEDGGGWVGMPVEESVGVDVVLQVVVVVDVVVVVVEALHKAAVGAVIARDVSCLRRTLLSSSSSSSTGRGWRSG